MYERAPAEELVSFLLHGQRPRSHRQPTTFSDESDTQGDLRPQGVLIAETPQLQICSLAKERGYIDALEAALADHGASSLTTRQAAHVAAACYHSGYTETFSAPELLPVAVDRAFDNLFSLGEAE